MTKSTWWHCASVSTAGAYGLPQILFAISGPRAFEACQEVGAWIAEAADEPIRPNVGDPKQPGLRRHRYSAMGFGGLDEPRTERTLEDAVLLVSERFGVEPPDTIKELVDELGGLF